MNLRKRAEKLLESPLRVFHHTSFDDPKQRKIILGDLPGREKFDKETKEIRRLRNNILPEMRPCYEWPLLDFEQEQHLFRKMNYYKYRAKKLLTNMNPDRVGEKRVSQIENYLGKAEEIRNRIAECNLRLATQIMKGNITFYRERSLTESLLSDAYFDVLKSVDYFNWTRGFKFSTYATWVVKKNFFRDNKLQIRNTDKLHNHLDEATAELMESGPSGYAEESEHRSKKSLVRKLIGLLAKENPKQAGILEDFFGLHGDGKRATLSVLSKKFGVSKERVRQLKESGLEWIRDKMNGLNYEIELEHAG